VPPSVNEVACEPLATLIVEGACIGDRRGDAGQCAQRGIELGDRLDLVGPGSERDALGGAAADLNRQGGTLAGTAAAELGGEQAQQVRLGRCSAGGVGGGQPQCR